MKTTTQQLAASLALAGAALMAPMATDAATISWQTSVNMYQGSTVETFVDTTGDLAVAVNGTADTSGDEDVTVNGVAFTGAGVGETIIGGDGESITINGGTNNVGSFLDGEFSSNGNIFHLIRGAVFGVNSVTLGGLEVGRQYQIQVFTNDARGNRSSNFIMGFGDGTGSSSPVAFADLNNSPTTPTSSEPPTFPETDAGDSIIGTFTADSATLTFNTFGTSNGSTFTQGAGQSQVNGIQLRDLGLVPEPSSLALLGLGGLLIARRRRG